MSNRMNTEFIFLVFCITVIALTSIVYGKDQLASQTLSVLSEIHQGIFKYLPKDTKVQE